MSFSMTSNFHTLFENNLIFVTGDEKMHTSGRDWWECEKNRWVPFKWCLTYGGKMSADFYTEKKITDVLNTID